MVVPAPEAVQYEAGRLLLALAHRLPSSILQSSTSMNNLMSSLYSFTAPLPVMVQEKLFQAVSLLLLTTTSPPEPSIQPTYTSFIAPLTESLVQAGQCLSSSQPLDPSTLSACRRAARLLRALCVLYGPAAKRVTTVLFKAMEPCIPHLPSILSYSLSQVGGCH